ncbi:MAG: PIG-L family deacetylase [Anaerolineales bacterium]
MNISGERLLFLGAHPDDIELGCGALLAHVARQTEVRCITLSDNQKNPKLKNIPQEHFRSMEILGLSKECVVLDEFETRNFPRDRQQILEYLYNVNHEYAPDIVFAHTRADIHQDHRIVTEEALRAFRGVTVLGFDVFRSSYGFFPHFLVEVDEKDVELKLTALAQYETYADRYYFSPEVVRATMVRNGALAERPFAEGFDILRMVAKFQ